MKTLGGSPIRSLVVLVGLMALACAAPASAPQGTASSSGQPQYGGVINQRFESDPLDFDSSITGQAGTNGPGLRIAYESLLGFKVTPGTYADYNDYTPVPELAERWEVSPDAKTYTFHLRQGLKWPNMAPVNGRDLTAADVKFSLEYLSRSGQFEKMVPASQNGYMFEGLAGIDTSDASTVVVRFKDSFAPFINYVSTKYNPIMPHEIYERDGNFIKQMIGTGAFQLDESSTQRGGVWVFKKNPSYRIEGKPYLDAVRFLVIRDDSTANAAFQTKQLNLLVARDGAGATDIAKANPNAVRLDRPGSAYVLWMHTKKAPTSDYRIRKAIALAIDRDMFIKAVGGGVGIWSIVGATPLVDIFSQEEIKQILPYDPGQSKQLVKDAGFPNGLDIDFNYPSDMGLAYSSAAELAQAQLKQVGINLVLKGRPYNEDSALRKQHDFTMSLSSVTARLDVDRTIFGSFYPGQVLNYAEVDDRKLTALVAAQRREAHPDKRQEFIRQAVIYANTEVIPFANLYCSVSSTFWQPFVKNLGVQSDIGFYVVEAWLEK